MMVRIGLTAFLLAAFIEPAAVQAEANNWCEQVASLSDLRAAPDIIVSLVRQDKMDEAVATLKRQPVMPMSPRAARRWAGKPVARGYGHYLVRAGLITAGDQSINDFYGRPSDYRFETYYSPSTGNLKIISVTTGRGMSRPNNIALLVRSPVPIRQVSSWCFGVS